MRYRLYGSMAFLSIAVASLSAWAGDRQSAAALPGGDGSVVFVAHDYSFSGPDRLTAGLTTVRIVNEGRDLHHIQFLKLLQGNRRLTSVRPLQPIHIICPTGCNMPVDRMRTKRTIRHPPR